MTIAHFMNLDFFQIEVHPLSSLRWRLLENPHGSDRKYIDSFMVNLPASHVSFAGGGSNFWKGFPNKNETCLVETSLFDQVYDSAISV